MDMALTAADLASLDSVQKEAVLGALYVALIADGAPDPTELVKFTATIADLPWGKPMDELQALMRQNVLSRLTSATLEDKIAFLNATVPNIPAPLRERVMHAMVAIAAADKVLTRGEKNSMNAFIQAFGLSEAQIQALREKFSG